MPLSKLAVACSILFLCIFALVYCSDTSSDVEDDTSDPFGDDDDDDNDTADHTPPDPPEVDDPRTPTTLTEQSITGNTEMGALISVTGGTKIVQTAADETTGDFCITVPLLTNEVNSLFVTAEDAGGNLSDATNVIIEQVTNVARYGEAQAASTSHSEPSATPDKGMDGDYASYWANTTQTVIHPEADLLPQWYGIKLDQPRDISRIKIFWGDDGYATKYKLYAVTVAQPDKWPHAYSDDWETDWEDDQYTLIQKRVNALGSDKTDEFIFETPVNTYWLMVVLYESNNINLVRYKYKIIELEGYIQSDETDPGCP